MLFTYTALSIIICLGFTEIYPRPGIGLRYRRAGKRWQTLLESVFVDRHVMFGKEGMDDEGAEDQHLEVSLPFKSDLEYLIINATCGEVRFEGADHLSIGRTSTNVEQENYQS